MDSDRKKTDVAGEGDRPGLHLSSGGRGASRAVRLDRATQTRIGDQLRAMYGELLEQPVPERFRSLLEQLDGVAAERRADGAGDDREASR